MSAESDIWSDISTPTAVLKAKRHPLNRLVWLAVDHDSRRHILVSTTSSEPGQVLLQTRALRATTRELRIAAEQALVWVDIEALDPAQHEAFSSLALDLASRIETGDGAFRSALQVLHSWKAFWEAEKNSLSVQQEAGIFAELWFIRHWMKEAAPIRAWTGPEMAIHDFRWPDNAVEVKATLSRSDGFPVHRISSLDQLDDVPGASLYLFSMQLTPDNESDDSVERLAAEIVTGLGSRHLEISEFRRRLAFSGYSGEATGPHPTFRVLTERLYEVGLGFPRLTRSSLAGPLPVGIEDIGYSLDLAACGNWLCASHPSEFVPDATRQGAGSDASS